MRKYSFISRYLDYRRTIDTCLYNENVAKELSKTALIFKKAKLFRANT